MAVVTKVNLTLINRFQGKYSQALDTFTKGLNSLRGGSLGKLLNWLGKALCPSPLEPSVSSSVQGVAA